MVEIAGCSIQVGGDICGWPRPLPSSSAALPRHTSGLWPRIPGHWSHLPGLWSLASSRANILVTTTHWGRECVGQFIIENKKSSLEYSMSSNQVVSNNTILRIHDFTPKRESSGSGPGDLDQDVYFCPPGSHGPHVGCPQNYPGPGHNMFAGGQHFPPFFRSNAHPYPHYQHHCHPQPQKYHHQFQCQPPQFASSCQFSSQKLREGVLSKTN